MADTPPASNKAASKLPTVLNWVFAIALLVCAIVLAISSVETHTIGEKESRTSEEGEEINIVYVGASSRIYSNHDSDSPLGTYIELLSLKEIAEAIDSNKFPVALQYWAETPSTERYLVRLKLEGDSSPQEYWIELPAQEESTPP